MKRVFKVILCAAALTAAFYVGHLVTVCTLAIETDGDGDSAIVTTLGGHQYLCGINGYPAP